MKILKSYSLKKTEFLKLLKTFDCYAVKVENLQKYKCGYIEKNIIYYTEDSLICTESHLNYLHLLDNKQGYTDWKQVIINLDNEADKKEKLKPELTGSIAKGIVVKALLQYYSKEELTDILSSYKDSYDPEYKQYHYNPVDKGLYIYKNCYAFDINGAHNEALVEMLPAAADYFRRLYTNRKVFKDNKKLVNYFVGTFNINRVNEEGITEYLYFPGAYNHIVQKTTKKLFSGIEETNGTVIYANTDGFITQNPEKLLEASTELGKWKLEAQGDIYVYVDKNYFCIQYINSEGKLIKKGNLLNEVRDKVDLFSGKVVHYEKVLNEYGIFEAKNISTEIIKGEIL